MDKATYMHYVCILNAIHEQCTSFPIPHSLFAAYRELLSDSHSSKSMPVNNLAYLPIVQVCFDVTACGQEMNNLCRSVTMKGC